MRLIGHPAAGGPFAFVIRDRRYKLGEITSRIESAAHILRSNEERAGQVARVRTLDEFDREPAAIRPAASADTLNEATLELSRIGCLATNPDGPILVSATGVVAHLTAMVDVVDLIEREQDRLDVRKGGREVGIFDDVRPYLPHHRGPNLGIDLPERVEPTLERQELVFAQVLGFQAMPREKGPPCQREERERVQRGPDVGAAHRGCRISADELHAHHRMM